MSFYLDFTLILSGSYPNVILISPGFYPDFTWILSQFYPDFTRISSRFHPDFLKTHFILIWSLFLKKYGFYLDKIRIKSGLIWIKGHKRAFPNVHIAENLLYCLDCQSFHGKGQIKSEWIYEIVN